MNRNKLMQFLVAIWPTVYKVINSTVYFLWRTIRNFIRDAFNMIRYG